MIGGVASFGTGLVNAALGPNGLEVISTGGPAQSALMIGGLAAGGIAALAGLRKAASLNPRTI